MMVQCTNAGEGPPAVLLPTRKPPGLQASVQSTLTPVFSVIIKETKAAGGKTTVHTAEWLIASGQGFLLCPTAIGCAFGQRCAYNSPVTSSRNFTKLFYSHHYKIHVSGRLQYSIATGYKPYRSCLLLSDYSRYCFGQYRQCLPSLKILYQS